MYVLLDKLEAVFGLLLFHMVKITIFLVITLLEHTFKELLAIISVDSDQIVLIEKRLDFVYKETRGRLTQKMEQLHFLTNTINIFHTFVKNTQDAVLLVIINFTLAILLREYLGDIIQILFAAQKTVYLENLLICELVVFEKVVVDQVVTFLAEEQIRFLIIKLE